MLINEWDYSFERCATNSLNLVLAHQILTHVILVKFMRGTDMQAFEIQTKDADTNLQGQVASQTASNSIPRRATSLALLSLSLDILIIVMSFLFVGFINQSLGLATISSQFILLEVAVLVAVWCGFTLSISLYDVSQYKNLWSESKKVILASVVVTLVWAGLLYIVNLGPPRTVIIEDMLMIMVSLQSWRFIKNWLEQRAIAANTPIRYNVLIIGANETGNQLSEILNKIPHSTTHIVGYLDDRVQNTYKEYPILGNSSSNIRQIVQQYNVDSVVITPSTLEQDQIHNLLMDISALSVRVHIVPHYINLALYRPTVGNLGGLPLIELNDPAMTLNQRIIKRVFDIVVSSILLLLTLPVMVIVAIAIKLDSPGPVFFLQKRIGENGRIFRMFKFRSMVENAEELQEEVNEIDKDGNVIHKVRNDFRVTKVGELIRPTSLDELPQLLNVLFGDMSLVGPRPELPNLVEDYENWQYQRFSVPQGITGWWQVTGRSDNPMHLNTDKDLYYIQNYSFWLDLRILLMTIPALLKAKGAF